MEPLRSHRSELFLEQFTHKSWLSMLYFRSWKGIIRLPSNISCPTVLFSSILSDESDSNSLPETARSSLRPIRDLFFRRDDNGVRAVSKDTHLPCSSRTRC